MRPVSFRFRLDLSTFLPSFSDPRPNLIPCERHLDVTTFPSLRSFGFHYIASFFKDGQCFGYLSVYRPHPHSFFSERYRTRGVNLSWPASFFPFSPTLSTSSTPGRAVSCCRFFFVLFLHRHWFPVPSLLTEDAVASFLPPLVPFSFLSSDASCVGLLNA